MSQNTHAHFSLSPVQYFSYTPTTPHPTHTHHPKKGDNFQQFYYIFSINLNVFFYFLLNGSNGFFLKIRTSISAKLLIVTNYTSIQKFGVNEGFLRSNNTFSQQVYIKSKVTFTILEKISILYKCYSFYSKMYLNLHKNTEQHIFDNEKCTRSAY